MSNLGLAVGAGVAYDVSLYTLVQLEVPFPLAWTMVMLTFILVGLITDYVLKWRSYAPDN